MLKINAIGNVTNDPDILQNGCYSPIIVNEDLAIVDGHNRQALCVKHGIPYEMKVFHFDDMLEAMRWAVDTQKARRNLTAWELGKIALKLKPELEAKGKANMSAGGGDQKSQEARQNSESMETAGSGERDDTVKSGLPKSANPISPTETRKSLSTRAMRLPVRCRTSRRRSVSRPPWTL